MNETLLKLLELQQERTRWVFLAKRQLNAPELHQTLEKYLVLDKQLAIEEQELIGSLNLVRELKDQQQGLFKRWTIKVLLALEVPNYVLGKMETTSNILDLYAELWRFWGEFGLAMKMEWMKIRIKTHQVSVYRMLAERLIQQMRRKLMVKIKSYRIFVRTTKPSLQEVPIIMTGSKILHQSPSPPLEKVTKQYRDTPTKTATPLKNRSLFSLSDHLIKSTNLERVQGQEKRQSVLSMKKKSYDRVCTSQILNKRILSVQTKKQVLKSIYQPMDIRIEESYPLRFNKEDILKSLLLRNNLASNAPIFKKESKQEPKPQSRLNTISDCIGKSNRKVDFLKKINQEIFVRNRISL